MKSDVFLNGSRVERKKFDYEEDLEDVMIDNYKTLFGEETIFLPKRKVETKSLGDTVPDGFLFDLRDKENPEFYLVEVELDRHDFHNHIFPQITKFIAFLANSQKRKDLIEKLYDFIRTDPETKSEFRNILENKDIHKIITDAVENSQDILLLLDEFSNNKPMIEESKEAYVEWDKRVKVEILRMYQNDKDDILTLTPPFEEVEISEVSSGDVEERYDENYHLSSTNEAIVETYEKIKEEILKDEDLEYNPQKYYISIRKDKNFAYLKIPKTKMHVVVTVPYEKGKDLIQHHKISELSQSVQDWYNASCFRITIEDNENLDEVVNILRKAAKVSG